MVTRCLLVGAAGFLGGHARARLAGDPAIQVTTADRRPDGVEVCLDLAADGPDRIAEVLREVMPDTVVNCAGLTAGEPEALVAGNVVAVAHLLDAIAAMPRRPRLVHLGSAAEYGAVPPGVPVREDAPARPVGTYGVTKLAGTALVTSAARRGMAAVVLRVFNPLGPGTPGSLLPGRLVTVLREARGGTDAGSGEPTGDGVRARLGVGPLDGHRDFVDVRDVAAAIAAAATAEVLPPLLNIGSGRATSLGELAGAMAVAAGLPADTFARPSGTAAQPAGAAGSPRSATVGWQRADLSAVTAALGWRPRIDLATSVRDMWQASLEDSVR